MDPWNSCQTDVTVSEIPITLKFEDNFTPLPGEKLPDSKEYLALLEAKLHKIKSDPNVLRLLAEKREACMRQLMIEDQQFEEDIDLDTPFNNSQLLRTILPQKTALNQGEIVELVKYDQLTNEDNDIEE